MRPKYFYLTLNFLILSAGCTHSQEVATRTGRSDNLRLAQVQLAPIKKSSVVGSVQFEQMPNSMIVMYRIEGLKPKATYQILVHQSPNCTSAAMSSAQPLLELKANKQGIAENTFKTEDFTVSKNNALLGNSILLVSRPEGARSQAPSEVACGRAEPQAATTSSNP